jgi:hypothetical protein
MDNLAERTKQTLECAFCNYENGMWRLACEKCGALLHRKPRNNQSKLTQQTERTVSCPFCRHENSTWRSQCEKCKASLHKFGTPTAATDAKRQDWTWLLGVAALIRLLLFLLHWLSS